MTKRGMTPEECDNLVIAVTLEHPSIIFRHRVFSDGSLGLRLQYGPREDQWITVCSEEQWRNPRIPALERAIKQAIAYAEQTKNSLTG